MYTSESSVALARLFAELVDGTNGPTGFVLNGGDVGLLASLDRLSAEDASRAVDGGATIAAHARHVHYGLSLMNRWAREGGNPFADATWDEAWTTREVDATAWQEIRDALRLEAHRWRDVLESPRDTSSVELTGIMGSVVHLAYHLGAVRQISRDARGPRDA
jgi:hypothetical protein